MRHATGAGDHYLEVIRVAVYRVFQRLPKFQAGSLFCNFHLRTGIQPIK